MISSGVVYPWLPFLTLLPGQNVHHASRRYYVGGQYAISTGAKFEVLPGMVDVGDWTLAPVSVHSVTWTIEGEDVLATLSCSATVGSDCRLVCSKDCAVWDTDNHVHKLIDSGLCNSIYYMSNCGAVSEFYVGPLHSVVDGPVVIEWDASSELYVWRYVD